MSSPNDPRFGPSPFSFPQQQSGSASSHGPFGPGGYAAQPAPAALPIGDRAGEQFHMQRGHYNAWAYVVIAFVFQIGLVALAVWVPLSLGLALALEDDVATAVGAGAGGLLGIVVAYFTFRDRWRCIEAFSSRYCSGLMNLSLLYVPIVALVYANVRGVKKLVRG